MQHTCPDQSSIQCPSIGDIDLTHVAVWAAALLAAFGLCLILARRRRSSCFWSFCVDPFRKGAPRLEGLRKGSYLGRWTEAVFYGLQWLSPATWRFGTRAASHNTPELRAEEPDRAKFVEMVVFIWMLLCALALWMAYRPRWQYASDVICALALLRVSDIVQAQINGHLWDVLRVESPEEEHVHSLQRSLLLTAINYVEPIGWFSAVYATLEIVCGAHTIGDYLYFSAITQLTVGYGDLSPACAARVLAPLQTMLGLVLLAVGVARLVAGIRAPNRQ